MPQKKVHSKKDQEKRKKFIEEEIYWQTHKRNCVDGRTNNEESA